MMLERSIAICIFLDRGRILAAPGLDRVTNERFFRPLGGAIEAGETPAEALHREVLEETGLAIEGVAQLAKLDNRFHYEGTSHREAVHVFDGAFVDRAVYDRPHVEIHEDVWEGPAQWLLIDALPPEPIYPEGIVGILHRPV